MRAVGVDACRGGWVAVVLDDGRLAAVCVRATLAEMVTACPGAPVIGVDMPLGLVPHGWRQATGRGRNSAGRRHSRRGRRRLDGGPDRPGAGQASSLPRPPQPGEAGQPIAIWY